MATDKPGGPPALSVIRGALDNPEPAAKVGRSSSPAPGDDEQQFDIPYLPAGCPVEPLGVNGQWHYYLDEQRQLIGLEPGKHAKQQILALFGRKSDLCEQFWPRYSDKTDKEGKPIITGWKSEVAAKALMQACAMRRIFDPQGRVRGTGAHRDEDGELVLHCGDKIFITGPDGGGYQDPGYIGGYVYPAGPDRPRPDPFEQSTAAAEKLLAMLKAWNWFRPIEDPMLALGWIGCAMLGGALNWRPHAWVTGGTGTGKSTLQLMLRSIFEKGALTTGDATEASLRQLLKQQTLPVFFDELEPDKAGDNRKNDGVIKLARLASSGEQALRGGQNHEGHEFTIRSCFLFSSILIPNMLTQDRNRLAILELDRIAPGKPAPTIDLAELRLLGRQIRKRLVDHWHRLDRMVERYKTALADVGHSGRSGDQFGTLLGVADLLLYEGEDEKNILWWAERFKAADLAEKETDLSDEEEVVQFLATSVLQQRGGDEPVPIVRMIKDAIAPGGLDGSNKAAERLENAGLRVGKATVTKEGHGLAKATLETPPKELYLAITNAHNSLERVFGETRWSGGNWSQSLQRVEGAKRRAKVRFGPGKTQWATLIPLSAMLELDERQA